MGSSGTTVQTQDFQDGVGHRRRTMPLLRRWMDRSMDHRVVWTKDWRPWPPWKWKGKWKAIPPIISIIIILPTPHYWRNREAMTPKRRHYWSCWMVALPWHDENWEFVVPWSMAHGEVSILLFPCTMRNEIQDWQTRPIWFRTPLAAWWCVLPFGWACFCITCKTIALR